MKKREVFEQNLKDAGNATIIVNDWMKKLGFDTEVLPYDITPNEESRYEYTDDGDIKMTMRVEVKQWKEIDFVSLEDVPYQDIIVDEKYKIDKRNIRTLYCYIILNVSKTKCLIIYSNTYKKWFFKELYDKKEKNYRTFYLCPKKYVKFQSLI